MNSLCWLEPFFPIKAIQHIWRIFTHFAWESKLSCSNHRSIFSRESMSPPSDSATHWPISRQSALNPSTSQEFFLLALFESCYSQRALSQQWRKTSLTSSPMDIPAWEIFTEDMQLLSTSNTNKPTLQPTTWSTSYSNTPFTNWR